MARAGIRAVVDGCGEVVDRIFANFEVWCYCVGILDDETWLSRCGRTFFFILRVRVAVGVSVHSTTIFPDRVEFILI